MGENRTRSMINGRGCVVGEEGLESTRFVGRTRELGVVGAALRSRAALVLVEGEAGIGKSRLIQELVNDRSFRMLVASAPPYRQPYTLGPVVDAVRQATGGVAGLQLSPLAGALRPLFPEWTVDLPPAPEPAEDPLAARHRLFRALAELLAKLDVDVLVTEDVHWADEVTLEFLLFLMAQRVVLVSLVLTYRSEDVLGDSLLPRLLSGSPAGGPVVRVSLGPLDVSETAQLVSSMLADEHVSSAFATFLHQRTDGLPLAIEESVRLMRDRDDLVRQRGEWVRRRLAGIQVPPTVREAVLERARRLGDRAHAALQAAAVLGDPTGPAALLATAGLPADDTEWLAALDSRLLWENPHGLIGFRHALAARAIYESISIGERRAMHLRAGQYLEATPRPPAIRAARHFQAAGDTARWWHYAELAAEAALAIGDDAGAVAVLQDVLTHADLPADTVLRLAEQLPLLSVTAGRLGATATALRRAIEAGTLRPAQTARLRYHLGVLLELMSEFDASRAELAAAIPDLSQGRPESVRAMLLLGWARGTSPREVHLGWLQRAAQAIEMLPPADRPDVAVSHAIGLLLLGEEEGWAIASRVPDGTGTAPERQTVVRRDLNLGEMGVQWGRYNVARDRLARALELTEAYQYPRLGDLTRATRAHLDWYEGKWSGLAEAAGAFAADDGQSPSSRLEFGLVAALVLAATGTRSAAEPALMRVLTEQRRQSAVYEVMEPSATLARWWLADGRVDDALHITDEPIDLLMRKRIFLWATDVVPARVEALIAAGRRDDAIRLVAEFDAGLADLAAPAPQAGLALCRAILAAGTAAPAPCSAHPSDAPAVGPIDRATEVAELFGQAVQAWRRLPRPYDALLAAERQATWLIAAQRQEAGLALLGEVSRELTELGAAADADRVARTLRSHGVSVPRAWRGGRRGYGDQLSPRELDVVRLVIAGRTNREIAAALYRSPKTVSTQLDSAMRKLNVSSRTALALAALEAGVTTAE